MRDLKESPSQTAGPYGYIGCVPSVAGLCSIFADQDLGAAMITGDLDSKRIMLELQANRSAMR